MGLIYREGNVLDAGTDALVIAVDGQHEKYVGAVGQQLAKRLDDDREWNSILKAANFPLATGGVHIVKTEDLPEIGFKALFFACMYNHHNRAIAVENAYHNALGAAHNYGYRSLATVPYRGGWRGTVDDALSALEAASARRPNVEVYVYERNSKVIPSLPMSVP